MQVRYPRRPVWGAYLPDIWILIHAPARLFPIRHRMCNCLHHVGRNRGKFRPCASVGVPESELRRQKSAKSGWSALGTVLIGAVKTASVKAQVSRGIPSYSCRRTIPKQRDGPQVAFLPQSRSTAALSRLLPRWWRM